MHFKNQRNILHNNGEVVTVVPVPQVVAYEHVYGMIELIVLLGCARPQLQIIVTFHSF